MQAHLKQHPFKLERYFAQYEFNPDVKHMLCISDCETMPMAELVAMADEELAGAWRTLSLGYTESRGDPRLLAAIAALYGGAVRPEGVIVGAPQELILLGLSALLEKNDHAVIMSPGYQSLIETARAVGAEVSLCDVTAPAFELAPAIASLLRPDTKLVVLNGALDGAPPLGAAAR